MKDETKTGYFTRMHSTLLSLIDLIGLRSCPNLLAELHCRQMSEAAVFRGVEIAAWVLAPKSCHYVAGKWYRRHQWTSGDLQRVSVSAANVFEADMRKADFLRTADLLT